MELNIIDSEGAPSPTSMPIEENSLLEENESYACTNCTSEIEITSLDNKKIEITFKCLNKNIQNNHGIKTLPIGDYINKMEKNTYLYNF